MELSWIGVLWTLAVGSGCLVLGMTIGWAHCKWKWVHWVAEQQEEQAATKPKPRKSKKKKEEEIQNRLEQFFDDLDNGDTDSWAQYIVKHVAEAVKKRIKSASTPKKQQQQTQQRTALKP